MASIRRASAVWKGSGLEGSGTLNTSNKFFNNTPYSFKTRFENEDGVQGTNPEELIAAAHSGCYAMALSFALANAGFTADELNVTAKVTLDAVEHGFEITQIELNLDAKISGISEDQFNELADGAKVGCPISKALSATTIILTKKLTN